MRVLLVFALLAAYFQSSIVAAHLPFQDWCKGTFDQGELAGDFQFIIYAPQSTDGVQEIEAVFTGTHRVHQFRTVQVTEPLSLRRLNHLAYRAFRDTIESIGVQGTDIQENIVELRQKLESHSSEIPRVSSERVLKNFLNGPSLFSLSLWPNWGEILFFLTLYQHSDQFYARPILESALPLEGYRRLIPLSSVDHPGLFEKIQMSVVQYELVEHGIEDSEFKAQYGPDFLFRYTFETKSYGFFYKKGPFIFMCRRQTGAT